jgi:adenylate cyclase
MFGELVPVGGGDPIPLLKKWLRVGRRESCDIVLRFANVSAHHCLLMVEEGYWFVKDLSSRNGVKVNDMRLRGEQRKRIDPNDVISIAKHKYELKYSPAELGAVGPPPSDDRPEDFLGQSLLERAGLQRRSGKADVDKRYDVTDNRPGQLKHDPNRPV